MTTKKDLIIAVLATFCLTLTLFGIIPTRSAGTYDPWVDTNEDGKIDGKDIAAAAKAFGTLGDPTKNVNVTNFPSEPQWNTQVKNNNGLHYNMSWNNYGGATLISGEERLFYCGGYSRVCIFVNVLNITHYNDLDFTYLNLLSVAWHFGQTSDSIGSFSYVRESFAVQGVPQHWSHSWSVGSSPLEVRGPYVEPHVFIENSTVQSGWALIDFAVYLRNE